MCSPRSPIVARSVTIPYMYEIFEHTADVGIRARAASLDELFADVARGLFSVIVENPAAVRVKEEVTIHVRGDDVEELFHDWLAELLYTFNARRIVLAEFDVRLGDCPNFRISKNGTVPFDASPRPGPLELTATARGESLDISRHTIAVEVKAITWCGLKVEHQPDGWLAEVVVDI
jgi:SHS2 domain-containing protein